MQITIELSHYPFQEDYRPIIKDTVARLNAEAELAVKTFPTATLLVGDYDKAMDVLKQTIAWSFDTHGRCVFVAKFIPDYDALASKHA